MLIVCCFENQAFYQEGAEEATRNMRLSILPQALTTDYNRTPSLQSKEMQ